VIGVAVRIERVFELQPELTDERGVARMLFEHAVYDDRLARILVCEEVGIRSRILVEKLLKDHIHVSQ